MVSRFTLSARTKLNFLLEISALLRMVYSVMGTCGIEIKISFTFVIVSNTNFVSFQLSVFLQVIFPSIKSCRKSPLLISPKLFKIMPSPWRLSLAQSPSQISYFQQQYILPRPTRLPSRYSPTQISPESQSYIRPYLCLRSWSQPPS